MGMRSLRRVESLTTLAKYRMSFGSDRRMLMAMGDVLLGEVWLSQPQGVWEGSPQRVGLSSVPIREGLRGATQPAFLQIADVQIAGQHTQCVWRHWPQLLNTM